jgi:hypothetical protein
VLSGRIGDRRWGEEGIPTSIFQAVREIARDLERAFR